MSAVSVMRTIVPFLGPTLVDLAPLCHCHEWTGPPEQLGWEGDFHCQ